METDVKGVDDNIKKQQNKVSWADIVRQHADHVKGTNESAVPEKSMKNEFEQTTSFFLVNPTLKKV